MSTEYKTIYGHLVGLKLCQIAGYDARLGDAAKRVFTMIAGYCGNDERCFPSLSQIAKRNCLSRAAIQKQIKILEEHGYLKRESRSHYNGGKAPSIIVLNGDLAREYAQEPHIFCKAHVTLVVTYLATLLRYRARNDMSSQAPETSRGDIKKTVTIKHNKDNKSKTTGRLLTNGAVRRASAWENEQQRLKDSGLSKEMNQQLQDLNHKLSEALGSRQYVDFTIAVQKEVKGMTLKDGVIHSMGKFEQKLNQLKDNPNNLESNAA